MGLYQVALSVFAVLATAAASGIPMTVSRLITKYRARNNQKAQQSVVAAALVAGICDAAWLASGQLTWMPSVAAIVSTAVAVAVLVVASHLEPPALDLQEEWEEAASSEG